MHSSGSMTRKLGPSWKQSTGHTSTQSVYLHLMQFSVTTWVTTPSWRSGTSAPLLRLRIGRRRPTRIVEVARISGHGIAHRRDGGDGLRVVAQPLRRAEQRHQDAMQRRIGIGRKLAMSEDERACVADRGHTRERAGPVHLAEFMAVQLRDGLAD